MQTRAPAEPDVREFEATVERVDAADGPAVVLDETYFYPESGGQPADEGTLAGVPVADVRKGAEGVVHHLTEDAALAPGDDIVGVIDDDFRTYCTRAHTASHLLYGAGRRLLDDLGYGGFGIDAEKVRVERARARDDVAFNTKTEEGVMDGADTVRLVDIEGWDVAACGGTHVSNTRAVGPVEVLERSNPGEGLTRVEFAVGPPAIDRRATVREAALDAARTLGTSVDTLNEAVAELRAERDDVAADARAYKSELLEARLDDLPTAERDGTAWRVGTIADFGPNEVGEAAQDRVGDDVDVMAVVGEGSAPYVVVATAGGVDAGDLVADLTDEFGGGGGGGPTFAQGGGLDAAPETVVAALRDT
ncbi:MAG: DHHA1 domain-containing protein [Haloplanus sp.]